MSGATARKPRDTTFTAAHREVKAAEPPPPTYEELKRSTADLQNQKFNPIKWIVPKYLPEGLTLWVGRPKAGKSWSVLDLAIAVASGGTFIGEKCEIGDALYLALEDGDRRLQSRMTKILGMFKGKWPAFTYATHWPRLHEGCAELIKEWIAEIKAKEEGSHVSLSSTCCNGYARRPNLIKANTKLTTKP